MNFCEESLKGAPAIFLIKIWWISSLILISSNFFKKKIFLYNLYGVYMQGEMSDCDNKRDVSFLNPVQRWDVDRYDILFVAYVALSVVCVISKDVII